MMDKLTEIEGKCESVQDKYVTMKEEVFKKE